MGTKVKQLRESKKMTQEELASLSGVSRVTIWEIENNSGYSPLSKTLARIADALGTTMDDLFFRESV